MSYSLDSSQIGYFADQGYLAPLPALTAPEANECRARVEELIERLDDRTVLRTKAHLHAPVLMELVHHPAIVIAVNDLLGPNVLCRSSSVFLKEPGTTSHVAWHQDATYWELDPPDVVTAWIALTESTAENGALQVLPGSHRMPLLAHGPVDEPGNMLSRGQAIIDTIDEERAVTLILSAGQMSIHDVRVAHRSAENRSAARRIGFAIRYVAAHVRKTGPRRDTALLVSGVDTFGNFDPEPEFLMGRTFSP